jgi:hypothetical protein
MNTKLAAFVLVCLDFVLGQHINDDNVIEQPYVVFVTPQA